jgi:uncharacterized membrane protein
MTGTTMSGGMMGNGAMGGIGWMWIPTFLVLGLGALLAWIIFAKKEVIRNCPKDQTVNENAIRLHREQITQGHLGLIREEIGL